MRRGGGGLDGSAAAAIAVMAPGPLTAILVPFLGRKSNKKYEKLQTGRVTMAVLSMQKASVWKKFHTISHDILLQIGTVEALLHLSDFWEKLSVMKMVLWPYLLETDDPEKRKQEATQDEINRLNLKIVSQIITRNQITHNLITLLFCARESNGK